MSHPPPWLAQIANRVASQFHAADQLAPIGCHYYHDGDRDLWEVTLFVSRTETVGGEYDGQFTHSRFSVDLTALESMFSEVHQFFWQAVSMGEDDDLGPHLSLEGRVEEHNVWLRIVAEAPPQFEPGRIADAYHRNFQDRW